VKNIEIEEWENWLERGLGSIVKNDERNHFKSKT
jgi:hypothetical protein